MSDLKRKANYLKSIDTKECIKNKVIRCYMTQELKYEGTSDRPQINKTMKTYRHISAVILSTSSRNGISIFCSDFTGRNNGFDTGYGFR